VHKRVLMVVVVTRDDEAEVTDKRCFGTVTAELLHLAAWLQERGSKTWSWSPRHNTGNRYGWGWTATLSSIWCRPGATVRRAARRRTSGCGTPGAAPFGGRTDPELCAGSQPRLMRTPMRRRTQLTRERVRIQNQVESLLEETRIKLSGFVSDLFGATGLRMLTAVVAGQTDPVQLAALADARIQRWQEELVEALTGQVSDGAATCSGNIWNRCS
jgi:hypothetical protein